MSNVWAERRLNNTETAVHFCKTDFRISFMTSWRISATLNQEPKNLHPLNPESVFMSFTDIKATNEMFEALFPQNTVRPIVTEMRDGFTSVSLATNAQHMRPGNMVSGPTQMSLADTVAYVCIFTKIGITPMAVTTSLNMHFLRPCMGPAIRAEGKMIRIGKSLAVVDVQIFGEGHDEPSSVATVTYALPKPQTKA